MILSIIFKIHNFYNSKKKKSISIMSFFSLKRVTFGLKVGSFRLEKIQWDVVSQ
jgi:hypothetical protein